MADPSEMTESEIRERLKELVGGDAEPLPHNYTPEGEPLSVSDKAEASRLLNELKRRGLQP